MHSDSQARTRICPLCQAEHGICQAEHGNGETEASAAGEDAGAGGLIGTILDGRFYIEASLGDGGMGSIYRARHLLLSKPLAIKVLRRDDDEVARRRFLQEARVASCVRHPHIIDISDYGVLPGGHPYLVMELLTGGTLGKALVDGPMPARRACRIAVQIAGALQAVHDKGIVHRDLKPDNVYLLADEAGADFVKIFDFGIAKVVAGPRLTQVGLGPLRPATHELTGGAVPTEQFTREGIVLGTPEYMAPEQVLGREVDHRTDQYALGCILYEMLTGALPFNHPELEVIMRKQVTEPVIPMCERRPDLDIPASLDEVVQRSLRKQRRDRFPTMRALEEALLAELRRLDEEEPVREVAEEEVAEEDPLLRLELPPAEERRLRMPARWVGALAGGALLLWLLGSLSHRVTPGPARGERGEPPPAPAARGAAPVQVPALAAEASAAPASTVATPVVLPAPRARAAAVRPRPVTVRIHVPRSFAGGVKISCAQGQERRCRGRCDIELPGGEGRCVASYPGYLRKRLLLRPREAPDEGPIVLTESLVLSACMMMPNEDCEPIRKAVLR